MESYTFSALFDLVMARAALALPDAIVRLADLSMTREGHLVTPGSPSLRLNGHARKQLASLVGVRWNKWFATATPEERAEEVTRRLARTPGEIKVRAWKDDTGEAGGVARALLSPSFTPIDDARIFGRLATVRGVVEEYRFTRVAFTEATSHYTAVHTRELDVRGDLLRPGWALRNSEVGGAALTLDDYWLRLVCTNGLMLPVGGKRALYRTHRAIEDDHLSAALVIALAKLPDRWEATASMLARAMDLVVPHPDAAVAAALDSPEVPRPLVEAAQRAALGGEERTRYGVVQAITYVAHAENTDADVRFAMERLAGDYLAAEPS